MVTSAQIHRLRLALRLRRRELLLVRALMVATAMVLILAVAAWAFSAAAPPWWAAALAPDTPASSQTATRLENAVVTQLSESRPPAATGDAWSPPWAVRIKAGDINAWLSSKLPRWLDGGPSSTEWTSRVRGLRVDLAPGMVTLGASVRIGDAERVVWVRARPEVRDGALWLADVAAGVGRLRVPVAVLLPTDRGAAMVQTAEIVRDGLDPAGGHTRLLASLAGSEPLARDASTRLHDGRRVRLLDVVVEDGAIVLTCTTGRDDATEGASARPRSAGRP